MDSRGVAPPNVHDEFISSSISGGCVTSSSNKGNRKKAVPGNSQGDVFAVGKHDLDDVPKEVLESGLLYVNNNWCCNKSICKCPSNDKGTAGLWKSIFQFHKEWIVDAGSGQDLCTLKLKEKEKSALGVLDFPDVKTQNFQTAAGKTVVEELLMAGIPYCSRDRKLDSGCLAHIYLMESSPPVLSVARRVLLQGFDFIWLAHKLPLLVAPDGTGIILQVRHGVPYLTENEVFLASQDCAAQQTRIERLCGVSAQMAATPRNSSLEAAPAVEGSSENLRYIMGIPYRVSSGQAQSFHAQGIPYSMGHTSLAGLCGEGPASVEPSTQTILDPLYDGEISLATPAPDGLEVGASESHAERISRMLAARPKSVVASGKGWGRTNAFASNDNADDDDMFFDGSDDDGFEDLDDQAQQVPRRSRRRGDELPHCIYHRPASDNCPLCRIAKAKRKRRPGNQSKREVSMFGDLMTCDHVAATSWNFFTGFKGHEFAFIIHDRHTDFR